MKQILFTIFTFLLTTQAFAIPFSCSLINGEENQSGDFDIRKVCLNDQFVIVYMGYFESSTSIFKLKNNFKDKAMNFLTRKQSYVLELIPKNENEDELVNRSSISTLSTLEITLINDDKLSYNDLIKNPNKVILSRFENETLVAEKFQTFDIPIEN